jgi:hypothetical protein
MATFDKQTFILPTFRFSNCNIYIALFEKIAIGLMIFYASTTTDWQLEYLNFLVKSQNLPDVGHIK